ncbi:septum site-determining protein Ssd [Haloglycomyces albus]|uniref:septum site-determining protein Ssd n=1 Tax=Haloglycomyces albus TaxID=526067 RepID=UPI00046CFCB6|nr:septum site-determining protein Ssd [Haloglycomyces albus]
MPSGLLISADATLIGDVRALAASSECGLTLRTPSEELRADWNRADVVVVDSEQLQHCLRRGLPRRRNVIVCHTGDESGLQWLDGYRLGADNLIAYPAGKEWLTRAFDRARHDHDPARVVAVQSGHGKAGATTLACALALYESRRQPTILIDLDAHSGGVDHRLNLATAPGWRWPTIRSAKGDMNPARLLEGLPHGNRLYVLSHTVSPHNPSVSLLQSVYDAATTACGAVYLNLPTAPDDTTEFARDRADATVLCGNGKQLDLARMRAISHIFPAHPNLGLMTRRRTRAPDTPHSHWGEIPQLRHIDTQLRRRRLGKRTQQAVQSIHRIIHHRIREAA